MRGSNRHGNMSNWKFPLPTTLLPTSWLVGVRGVGHGVPESYPPWARVAGLASRSSQQTLARVFAGVRPLDALYMMPQVTQPPSHSSRISLLPGSFPITTVTRFSDLGYMPGLTASGNNCLGPVPGRLQTLLKAMATFSFSRRRYHR
jgi:hypothetical protein